MNGITAIVALTAAAIGGIVSNIDLAGAAESAIYRYVITETAGPTSLDPLDADNAQNLAVMRMIYATPLEITGDNQLASGVLESFKYDSTTTTITWVVKPGLKFDDGAPLTPEDVAFAVARMAFARPTFPVLEQIGGVSNWAKQKGALKTLPNGIKIDGQKITIKLERDLEHPLFRFCLELFSIIPKKCVDPVSNKIQCASVPSSGYYRMAERGDKSILFKRSGTGLAHGLKIPEIIKFEYATTKELAGKKVSSDKFSVFAGNEQMYLPAEIKSLESDYTVKYMPAARFAALLLNPNSEPFKDRLCRRFFADTFRATYEEVVGRAIPVEASLFTKILPGYLPPTELSKMAKNQLNPQTRERCQKLLSKSHITWGFTEAEKSSNYVAAFKQTLERLENKNSEPIHGADRGLMFDQFASGKLSALNISSGFWALDPAGDVKMLFTPGLHKVFTYQSKDKQLQNMISSLSKEQKGYTQLNQYLYDEALFNVYSHLRRFYASPNKKLINDVPFAISSPAPWQVFGADL